MKELSVEEKAKRYDEAIKHLKGMIPSWESLSYNGKTFLQDLFCILPELKESEDVKIIKEMKDFFSHIILGQENFLREDYDWNAWIAWLEKQGEQPKKHDVCDNCDQQGSCVSPCPMKLVEKQGEQKPAWSEEDETALGNALWCCKQAASIAKDENDMGNVWYAERGLKSLKNRVQPKHEWSEEDEKMLENAISSINHDSVIEGLKSRGISYSIVSSAHLMENLITWLKSLRPQNTWKPSDEQMRILHWCMPLWVEPKSKAILESLINDLKKLKGEE